MFCEIPQWLKNYREGIKNTFGIADHYFVKYILLGVAASLICLEKEVTENALAQIEGIGYSTQPLMHNVSISMNALYF